MDSGQFRYIQVLLLATRKIPPNLIATPFLLSLSATMPLLFISWYSVLWWISLLNKFRALDTPMHKSDPNARVKF